MAPARRDHAVIARLAAECVPSELGAKSLTDVLARRLRISRAEARRRLGDAEDLGPRTALTGEPLEPMLPNVAQAQAGGTISPEHVRITIDSSVPVAGARADVATAGPNGYRRPTSTVAKPGSTGITTRSAT